MRKIQKIWRFESSPLLLIRCKYDKMKRTIKELDRRQKYLDRLFKICLIVIVIGFAFIVAGMFVTLLQLNEIGKIIVLINKENKSMKKIKLYPYQDIIEKLLKKEKGWIADLDSLQKEIVNKTLYILQEDNKRKEKYIKVFEEIRELLHELNKNGP